MGRVSFTRGAAWPGSGGRLKQRSSLFFAALGFFSRFGFLRAAGDRGDREVAIGDDRGRACGELDVRNVDGVTDLEAGEVDRQGFRNVVRGNVQLDFVTNDIQCAALLEARGLLFVSK